MKKLSLALLCALFPGAWTAPAQVAPAGSMIPEECCTPVVCECDPCCAEPETRFWVNGEYLLWWIKNNPVPVPLATEALPPFTSDNPGALGDPQARVLLGADDLDPGLRLGARLMAGWWLDCDHTTGLEASGFILSRRSVTRSVASDGSPDSAVIGVPFFDVTGATTLTGQPGEAFRLLSLGGISAGRSSVTISSSLNGAEASAVFNLPDRGNVQLAVLAGFRYLELLENMALENLQTDPGFLTATINTRILDEFDTHNHFHGGQVGARVRWSTGCLFLEAAGKVALGNMHETVDVSGRSSAFLAGFPPVAAAAGLFAQASNSGRHERDEFAVIPELTVNVGVAFADTIHLAIGYNFLYLSDVVRPGNQVDRQVNLTQSPLINPGGTLTGPALPSFRFSGSDFWAQGLQLGMQLSF